MLFDALGTLDARDSGVSVDLGPPQRRAVLGVLLVSANRPVHTDRLIDAVWDGNPSPNAAGALHVHISRLRRVLGTEHLVRKSPGYMLCADEEDLTVSVFERLAEEGRNALAVGEAERASCVLGEALGLWRGEAYEDFVYADWSRPERARLDELRLDVHEAHIDANLDLGNHAAVLPELERLIAAHPTHERFCAQHMLALYRSQRMVAALDVFRRYRKIVHDEMGLDPSPGLLELERRILDHDDTLLRPGRDGHGLVPVLTGAGVGSRPASQKPKSALPSPLTTFVGRTTEISAVSELVAGHRLVTIVGPGGAGKSRLALEVATRTTRPDGTFWVDLSSTRGVVDVVATIWTSLGFTRPPTTDGTRALARALERRDLLVVLDCCEPVIDELDDVICAVLESSPQVRMLCTSRQPLRVPGERVWRVPLLTVPNPIDLRPDEFAAIDALELFTDRAQASDDTFRLTANNVETVAEICRRVDGLPLGIEIAAAYAANSSPSELLSRFEGRFAEVDSPLHGIPARHRSLTNTIRWSYEMLEPSEQVLLERLALIEPPIRTTDVVAMDLVDAAHATDALGELADQSLLARIRDGDATDYRMLDTVRAFAAARFEHRDDRADVTERLARHYAGIAASGKSLQMDEFDWIRSMRKCERNIERAIAWCAEYDPELGTEVFLGAYLYVRWITRSWPTLETAAEAIARSTDLSEPIRLRLQACILSLQSNSVFSSEKVAAARSIAESPIAPPDAVISARGAIVSAALYGHADLRSACEECLESLREVGMAEHTYLTPNKQYMLFWLDGDLRSAHAYVMTTLASDNRPGHSYRRALFLRDLADASLGLGERARALDAAEAALEAAAAIGSEWQQSLVLDELALILLASDDPVGALSYAIRATDLAHDISWIEGEIESLLTVALACDQLGDLSLARDGYGAAMCLIEKYNTRSPFLYEKTDVLEVSLSDADRVTSMEIEVPVSALLARATSLLHTAHTAREPYATDGS